MRQKNSEILIVGAGPVGLTAALTLAQKKIPFHIIDRRAQPITTSNALGIQPKTMELFEELGIIDDALQLGHRVKGISFGTPEKVLGEILLDPLPTKYPFILILPQARTEEILTKHLKKLGVSVEREITLTSLTQQKDSVEALCNQEMRSYSWVFGCDGANSTVRDQAGITFKGKNLSQHFIMADLNICWDRPFDLVHSIMSDDGPMIFFPFNGKGHGRLVIDVTGDRRYDLVTQPVLEDFQKLVQERLGSQATVSSPDWTSSFRIQGRIAKSYRKGRVFLAGDAAHRHSPFGGQGLNMGVHDAHLLATLMSRSLSDGNFKHLDRYESERRSLGEAVVSRTSMMTQVMTTRSKVLQAVRNMIMKFLLKSDRFRYKVAMNITQLDQKKR